MKSTLIVAGVFMLGYLLPELLLIWKIRTPTAMNVWAGADCALIAATMFL